MLALLFLVTAGLRRHHPGPAEDSRPIRPSGWSAGKSMGAKKPPSFRSRVNYARRPMRSSSASAILMFPAQDPRLPRRGHRMRFFSDFAEGIQQNGQPAYYVSLRLAHPDFQLLAGFSLMFKRFRSPTTSRRTAAVHSGRPSGRAHRQVPRPHHDPGLTLFGAPGLDRHRTVPGHPPLRLQRALQRGPVVLRRHRDADYGRRAARHHAPDRDLPPPSGTDDGFLKKGKIRARSAAPHQAKLVDTGRDCRTSGLLGARC